MPNQLIHEQSPYLLQHAHNPVDWHPWGDAAFGLAKAQHKPVIVSIGYAACHWCHVMERESFEDPAAAAYMNEHFICIKVDREEHPDVDHLYMDAVQAITGSGGWPLNAFVTPDRVPFYGGTYFPPEPVYGRPSWMQILGRMHEIWTTKQEEVTSQTAQMLRYLQQTAGVPGASDQQWDRAACDRLSAALLAMADKEWGGFGNAPKFPGTMAIRFLLGRYHFFRDEDALQQALVSIDRMIDGGLYDQLGGGFARYSTDRYWLAPHFEKMLYDNALLVTVLCEAFQLTGNKRYRQVIEETLAFAARELQHPDGGYYSALDADSEGVEGKFYTWTWHEWLEAFPDGNPAGAAYFGVTEAGNWEETNILHVPGTIEEIAAVQGLSVPEAEARIAFAKEQLLRIRAGRIRPHTDDKCLLSWNALMNLALTAAGTALSEPSYLDQARTHMDWMIRQFSADGELRHAWNAGPARIPAKLDDYAYLIQAQVQLGAAVSDHRLILAAAELQRTVLEDFGEPGSPFCYFTSRRQADIPVRKTDTYDGATPSANAVTAHNLVLLGLLMERREWLEQGKQMLNTICGTAVRYPYSFGYWAMLLQEQLYGFKTIRITGPGATALHREIYTYFLPGFIKLRSLPDGGRLPLETGSGNGDGTRVFVCDEYACGAPELSIAAALGQAGILLQEGRPVVKQKL